MTLGAWAARPPAFAAKKVRGSRPVAATEAGGPPALPVVVGVYRHVAQAIGVAAASCSPSVTTDCWRIRYFCTLPVMVIGKASTNRT